MTRTVRWRLHCRSSPDALFKLLGSDQGRERFWAERSKTEGNRFRLTFPDGTKEVCEILESVAPSLLRFSYFGSVAEILLESDGRAGTDLTLINRGVTEEEYQDVNAGWLSVLLPLKAIADFGVDLRNHDPGRTWREGYVDQ